uniref:Uncharacterized protein B15I20.040 n=1 Tax=Neurospora crassa TaxID=5141 RepID=Q96U83_NEUCS|nr:hypothetical protein [Neurospora crassa]
MRGVKRTRTNNGDSDIVSTTSEAMQNALAEQFEALGSDVGLRLANLRTLFSSLTPQETQFMRLHLQSLPPPADIIARFPTDILVEISPYFSTLDIVNILNVSKAWRKSWAQRDVVRALAKHHMPNFLPFYAHRNRLQSPEACTDQDLFNSFYQAARKFSIRQQGLFQSMICNPGPWLHFVTRDRFFTLEPTDSIRDWDDVIPDQDIDDVYPDRVHDEKAQLPDQWRNFRFCNGKLAWQVDSDDKNLASLTFVDDLRSQRRKVYKVPVPVVLHGCVAYLRDLGSERDSVTLPSAEIQTVKIEGKRVYILNPDAKVYVWTFKQGVREVDTSEARKYAGPVAFYWGCINDADRLGIFDLIPHPLLDDTFYLLALQDDPLQEKPERALVVLEYNHSGTLHLHTTALPQVRSFTRTWGTGDFNFGFNDDDDVELNLTGGYEDIFVPITEKVDAYGNYAVCQFHLEGWADKPDYIHRGVYDDDDLISHENEDEDGDEYRPVNVTLGFTVFFNALTASVSTSPFMSATGVGLPSTVRWGGQQIDLVFAPTKRKDVLFAMLLISESDGQKRLESMDDLPVHCPSTLEAVEPIPVTHRLTKRLDQTPAKAGKMMHGHRCSNVASRFLTESLEFIPSLQPLYGLDITFEYEQLIGKAAHCEDDNPFCLAADEDFFVCMGPKGYVAWSFCHDMKDLQVKA